jgi:AcrR family transcriptional regulator
MTETATAETTESDGQAPQRLPSGRHSLPRDFVRSNQEERLVAAAARALGSRSYAELAVSHITHEAGVSRATFYQIFEGKRACVLAAHRIAAGRLEARIEEAWEGLDRWEDIIAAGVSAALRFAEESPHEARLLILPALGADSELTARALAVDDQLIDLLRKRGAGRTPPPHRPQLIERALISGVTSIVADHLISGETHLLAELEPQLVELMLIAYEEPVSA